MNYLAHHAVAQLADADAVPEFYAANLLPDLARGTGVPRLRAALLPRCTDAPIRDGIRLHLMTDRRFHAAPEFADLQRQATTLLNALPFTSPPPRRFFLVHIAVEIALDGCLLQTRPDLAGDLYDQLARSDKPRLCRAMAQMTGSHPAALADSLDAFCHARYLFHYATPDGQAEALCRTARRVSVAAFTDARDQSLLSEFFARLADPVADAAPNLILSGA